MGVVRLILDELPSIAAVNATQGLVRLARSNGVSGVTDTRNFVFTRPAVPCLKCQPSDRFVATQMETAGAIDADTMCCAIRHISGSSSIEAPEGLNTLLADT